MLMDGPTSSFLSHLYTPCPPCQLDAQHGAGVVAFQGPDEVKGRWGQHGHQGDHHAHLRRVGGWQEEGREDEGRRLGRKEREGKGRRGGGGGRG